MLKTTSLYAANRCCKGVYDNETGLVKFRNCIWFTNMDLAKRHEKIILWKNYTPEEFSKYDNYDAINVDKVSEIPCDYDGVIGVHITFLDKYNPERFEILGADEAEGTGFPTNSLFRTINISNVMWRINVSISAFLSVRK